ncbi:DMT family transporter [Sporolactobacillus laevolacticus]|uniref:Membrane protein n=1 Tax=Sporolactobacillus laevolacticus DSM 442 TaxID=1395513 RepID=V6IYV1_9BACL|nr:multidrug efflux SMR transporter [Sporolactobacillus laevolacticus]EST12610.1 membrane protein [Sporolactobacillus laevolacticus DSM 442]
MSWLYLGLAIMFEVYGTVLMKYSKGLSNLSLDVLMMLSYIISLSMLPLALKKIEIGTAYAVWSGMGIVFIVTIGVIFFKESLSLQKIVFIAFIVIGAIGLNLVGEAH